MNGRNEALRAKRQERLSRIEEAVVTSYEAPDAQAVATAAVAEALLAIEDVLYNINAQLRTLPRT